MMNIGQRSFKFKLGLLAWKSLCFRLNNMTLSSLEILLPIIYIFTFLSFNDVLYQENSVTNHSALSKFISEEFLFSHTFSNNSIYITYTPNNKWCEKLMRCVGTTLNIAKKDVSIVPMGDKLQLRSLIRKMKNKIEIIFIQFHTNNEHNENSTNLVYSIRYLDNVYLTFEGQQHLKEINFNHYTMPASWEEFVYWKTGYAGLELAIDKSFISMVANNRSISKVNIRPFPYPVRPLPHSNYVDGIEMSRAIVIAFFALRIVCIYLVYKEKQTGVIEYACALNMEKWMFYMNWFICVCIEYGILVTGIVYILYFEHPTILDHSPVLRTSEPFSIWCFFIIYVMADVLSNLVICSMSESRNRSIFFGIICWTIPFILYNNLEANPSKIAYLSSHVYWLVISPTIAFQFALEALFIQENNHYGFNLKESFIENETLDVVGHTMVTLLMSIIVYICIIWLVESRYSFWSYKIMKDSEPKNIALFSKSKQNMKSIDEPLPWMKIAIKIINLHKRNKLHNIIKGLHMNVYMGHITVLLSPNLINVITILQILTGMVQASYGKIIVQGTNVLQYSNKFKQLLGFSIDVNALFNSLSVKEHLMFFSILRGMTVKKAKHETFNLITFLNLQNQASCTPGMLSLGIRKRLCLAISLIGDPEFLILNQPTEHVDSESTKQLRDKIIAMRGKKTIIVATQSWDEATKLGDRIAVIYRGTLICYGTLSFLKQHYGSKLNYNVFNISLSNFIKKKTSIDNYSLKINIGSECNIDVLGKLISKFVPEVKLLSEYNNQLIYILPIRDDSILIKLVQHIEINKNTFGVGSLAVKKTTINDVYFMSGKIKTKDQYKFSTLRRLSEIWSMDTKYYSGLSLIFLQFWTLLKKKCISTKRYILNFGFFALLLIVLGSFSILTITLIVVTFPVPDKIRNSYHIYQYPLVLVRNEHSNRIKEYERFLNESFVPIKDDVNDELLKIGSKDIESYYKKYIAAFELKEYETELFFNPVALHSLPIAINIYSNTELQTVANGEIVTYNHPLESFFYYSCGHEEYELFIPFTSTQLLVVFCVIFGARFVIFPLHERVTGFYQMQILSNMNPVVYWIVCFIFDISKLTLISLATMGMMYALDLYDVIRKDIGVLFVLTELFMVSILILAYIFSTLFNNANTTIILYSVLLIGIGVGPIFCNMYASSVLISNGEIDMHNILYSVVTTNNVFSLFSPNVYNHAALKFMDITLHNNFCNLCSNDEYRNECKLGFGKKLKFFVEPNEANDYKGLLYDLYFLIGDTIIYLAIFVIIRWKITRKIEMLVSRLIISGFKRHDQHGCQGVIDEKEYIKQIKINELWKTKTLLIDNVQNINGWLKPKITDQVNLCLNQGECFAILGDSDARINDIINVISDNCCPYGKIFIKGVKLTKNRHCVGYILKNTKLNKMLTGKETLEFFANLRGVPRKLLSSEIETCIQHCQLEKYKDQCCAYYSHATTLKMKLAISMIGKPVLVVLDEPTEGTDPVTKQIIWDALDEIKKNGCSVLITTRSMEECEALCDRIMVMIRDKIKYFGNLDGFKSQYSGYIVAITLEETPRYIRDLDKLRKIMHSAFGGHDDIENRELLVYKTTVDITLYQMFYAMDRIKTANPIVLRYTISNMTWEHIIT